MKLKRLLALLGGAFCFALNSAFAQTDVFKDVTSTYLTNADFEGEYSVYSNPSKDRAIYQPTGWNVEYTNGREWDMTILKSSDLAANSFSSKPPVLSAGGSQTYKVRFNNSYKDQKLGLYQTVTLPRGNYKVTIDYYKGGSGGDAYLVVNSTTQNSGTNDSWTTVSISFESDGSSSTKIGCRADHTNTYEKFYAFDNFKLEWNLTQSLASLITSAGEVYNEDTSNTALKNAIDEANTHTSSSDADELETAYNDLSAAASLALKWKAWKTAKTAAETAIADGEYANVTGEEKTALQAEIDKAEPTTEDGYDAAKAALETATSNFTGAKTNYDAFVAAKTAANPSLSYAAEAKLTALTTAKAASATSSADAATKTTAITTALRAYYESHALAEGVAVAVNKTNLLTNYTNPTNTSGWTVTNTTGDCKLRTMSSEPYTNSDGTTATGYFDTNSWGTAFASTVTQNVNLAVGKYLLTVKARGNGTTTYQVTAGTEHTDITPINNAGGVFGRGWNDFSVEFEVATAGEVTIGMNLETGASNNWLSFGDFRLVKLDATLATAEDYANLNTAISTAEAKTLGFDEGEYAPYNNVDALTKLAEAKAINQSANNVQEDVRTITDALNGFSWTVNASDVDAIYNGNFALSTANETSGSNLDIPGWTPNGSIRQVIENGVNGTFPALAETTGGKAMFTWSGTFVYGEQSGYELPLNAHTIYELSFKHAGWNGSNNNFYVKITDDEGAVLPQQTCGKSNNGPQTAGCWNTYTIIFVTGNGGNHKLSMIPSGNSAFTDVTLSKAASQTLTFAEDGSTPKFAAGTYPTVALDRAFSTEKRSTMVLPFALTTDETSTAFEEVYELNNVEGQSIKLAEATEITAGKPYLVKAKNATLSVTGKAIDPSTTVSNTEKSDASSTVTFVGTFSPVVLTAAANANAYVVSSNTLYQVTSDVNVKAYRGYFTVDTTSGVKNFVLDFGNGETTSIEALENETRDKVIYNLAGQRVQKAQKGIFIVNGKKVVIK